MSNQGSVWTRHSDGSGLEVCFHHFDGQEYREPRWLEFTSYMTLSSFILANISQQEWGRAESAQCSTQRFQRVVRYDEDSECPLGSHSNFRRKLRFLWGRFDFVLCPCRYLSAVQSRSKDFAPPLPDCSEDWYQQCRRSCTVRLHRASIQQQRCESQGILWDGTGEVSRQCGCARKVWDFATWWKPTMVKKLCHASVTKRLAQLWESRTSDRKGIGDRTEPYVCSLWQSNLCTRDLQPVWYCWEDLSGKNFYYSGTATLTMRQSGSFEQRQVPCWCTVLLRNVCWQGFSF